jgi:1,4-dihydroxy-6-naphthoate synthase
VSRALRVGLSTCPNDTFAFHGLLTGAVSTRGLQLEFELADVQALNEGLRAGRFDAAKVSFAAALGLAGDHVVLPAGAALGFGVGPVVLAARPGPPPARPRVLCPGEDTTATLLWRLLHSEPADVRQVVFSQIMPALERGEADLGVCIHEGRFTWRARGLHLVEDLGERWERSSGGPLPLGGIVARGELGADVLGRLADALRASIRYGFAHRDEALETMRAHAAEHDDAVLLQHVELYVDDETVALSAAGRAALASLARRAREAGLASAHGPALKVAAFPEELGVPS